MVSKVLRSEVRSRSVPLKCETTVLQTNIVYQIWSDVITYIVAIQLCLEHNYKKGLAIT